jgi:hypothetical protein
MSSEATAPSTDHLILGVSFSAGVFSTAPASFAFFLKVVHDTFAVCAEIQLSDQGSSLSIFGNYFSLEGDPLPEEISISVLSPKFFSDAQATAT